MRDKKKKVLNALILNSQKDPQFESIEILIESLSFLNKNIVNANHRRPISLNNLIFNYFNLVSHMLNYQYYPLNLTHYTPNNLNRNTKIKIVIRFYFLFITHHIVQCKVKLFLKNIINFHLFFILFMKLIWLVLIY